MKRGVTMLVSRSGALAADEYYTIVRTAEGQYN
jgi:hypothetical protein